MAKTPLLFTANEIYRTETTSAGKDRIYRPCRGLRRNIRFARVRLAFGVLIGRYDALDWEGHL